MNSYFGTNYKAYTKEALDFAIISGSKDWSKIKSTESINKDSKSFYYQKEDIKRSNVLTHKFYHVMPVNDSEGKVVGLIGRPYNSIGDRLPISGSLFYSYAIAWYNFMHTMKKMNPEVVLLDTLDQYKEFALRYIPFASHEKHWIITDEYNTRVMAMYSYEIKNNSLILYNVYVNPAFRNQGLLKEMLKHAENECINHQCDRVFFTVYKKNVRAQTCYEKCGFTKTNTNYIEVPKSEEAQ